MTAPRWLRPAAAITTALTVSAAIIAIAISPTAAAPAQPQPCPAATCTGSIIITDGAKGMASPFYIEDNEGHPPGWNAAMFWVDGFQAGSVNPVCADATVPYLAHEACLGGPPFSATGGHPVLSLCAWVSGRDCVLWETLTPAGISEVNAVVAAGLTYRQLKWLARWLTARGVR